MSKRYHSKDPSETLPAIIILSIFLLSMVFGCVSDKMQHQSTIQSYQNSVAEEGPQQRVDSTGLDFLTPAPDPLLPALKKTRDATGKSIINLSLDDAIMRALANSPEITVVSFDPSIAREDITRAVSEFDIIGFGQLAYEKEDKLTDSIFEAGQTKSNTLATGVRQKGVTGAEWSITYALSRSTSERTTSLSPRYEPILSFQIRQPLLRDAWPDVNLAGITVSKLNYVSSLAAFRQRAEEVASEVIALYWRLLQAQRNVDIQQSLLEKTKETMHKVQNRKLIDASDVQIKQTEAFLLSREADLLNAKKQFRDVQDALVRFLSDHQLNVLSELELIPTTAPQIEAIDFDQAELIDIALSNNPSVSQAQLAVKISDVNILVANRQKMPRLDLTASSSIQGLSEYRGKADKKLWDGNYNSYAIGLTLEYPFGNRDRNAVLRQRKLEQSKAVSNLQNVSDQVATQIKERIRFAKTAYEEMAIQKKAANASKIYLDALENVEIVREELTPEFLLVKLQAQEDVADSQRSEIQSVVDYNVALTRLAQATGKTLELHPVKTALPKISMQDDSKLIIEDTLPDLALINDTVPSVTESKILPNTPALIVRE